MSGGAESKWKDEFVQMLENHMHEGWSFPSFGGVVKVSYKTLRIWHKRYPEFAAIVKKYEKPKTKTYF